MAIIRRVKEEWEADCFAFCDRCQRPVSNAQEDPAYCLERQDGARSILCVHCAKYIDTQASIKALIELIEMGVVIIEDREEEGR